MVGRALGCTGQCVWEIEHCGRWVPGSAGMETSGVLHSFKSITCFWRALHVKGALAVL